MQFIEILFPCLTRLKRFLPVFGLSLFIATHMELNGQQEITNGGNHDGSITLNETDLLTFSASENDKIFIRAAQLSGGNSFSPRVRIINEANELVGFSNGSSNSTTSQASIDFIAASTGDFTIQVDSGIAEGTGTYRLYFVNVAGAPSIPGGDHGGNLVEEANNDGSTSVGDPDPWTFTANSGDRVTLNIRQLSGGTSYSPELRVYDASGNLVGYSFSSESSSTSETELKFITTTSDDFLVLVESGITEGSGTYRLTYDLEEGPFTYPATSGESLTNGIRAEGSIASLETDTWTFPALAGERIIVRLAETDNGTGFHPRLELFAPDATSVVADEAPADGWVEATAEMDGTYFVTIRDIDTGASDEADDTGSYRVEAVIIPDIISISDGDEGGTLENGLQYNGIIDIGDIDTWTIEADAGDTITASLGETDNGTGLTPYLAIYGSDGFRLNSDSAPKDGRVSVVATVTGTYFVQVADFDTGAGDENDDTGSYVIESVVLPGEFQFTEGDEGGALANGLPSEGTITIGDLDIWTIEANQGDTITIRLGETDNGTGFTPLLALIAPNGELLDSNGNTVSGWATAIAPTTGTYFVSVSDRDTGSGNENDDTGSYRLEPIVIPGVFQVSGADDGGPITKGFLHEGTIVVGDIDTWTLEANEGDAIIARIGEIDNGSGFSPYLELRGPDGLLIDSDFGSEDNWVEAYASATGTHYLQIVDSGVGVAGEANDTGSYRLEALTVPGSFEVSVIDEGGVLENGIPQDGNITVGDIDSWTIEAVAGNRILARVGETDNGSGLSPYIRLLGPDGLILSESSRSTDSVASATAESSGTYTIQIADGTNGSETGSYRLETIVAGEPFSVSALDHGGELNTGESVQGSLVLGDLDPWSFEAFEGDIIFLEMTSSVEERPVFAVYDPSGAGIISGERISSTLSNAQLLIENTGTHTVVALGERSGDTGDYELAYTRYPGGFSFAEGDPSGWGGWSGEGALWQVGDPTVENGPPAFDGSPLAGTLLAEDYFTNADARLMSPWFPIPENSEPTMTYQEWYDTGSFADAGIVQVRKEGEDWVDISTTRVSGSGTEWAKKEVSLASYAGETIQIAFRFTSNASAAEKAGWFVDDVQINVPLSTMITAVDELSPEDVYVEWSGTSVGGSITGFDIYVREDNGPWELWIEDTTDRSAVRRGRANTRLGFFAAGRDTTGDFVQPPESNTPAQVETFVIRPVKFANLSFLVGPDAIDASFLLVDGYPADAWEIERAPSVKGPWSNVQVLFLDENGQGLFQDEDAPANSYFYRATRLD